MHVSFTTGDDAIFLIKGLTSVKSQGLISAPRASMVVARSGQACMCSL